MTIKKKYLLKRGVPILIGALLGYAYYYYIGCSSGTCPITSNPYISTVYGALIGFVFGIQAKKKDEQQSENN